MADDRPVTFFGLPVETDDSVKLAGALVAPLIRRLSARQVTAGRIVVQDGCVTVEPDAMFKHLDGESTAL